MTKIFLKDPIIKMRLDLGIHEMTLNFQFKPKYNPLDLIHNSFISIFIFFWIFFFSFFFFQFLLFHFLERKL